MILAYELAMILVLIGTLVRVSITDCRSSIIPNKIILRIAVFFCVMDVIYYTLFANQYCSLFFSNLLIVFAIATIFYFTNIWAAGDSKLLLVIGLGIPSRWYTYINLGPVPGFLIIVAVFSISFVYVIIDSIIIGIKSKTLFKFAWHKPDVLQIVLSYLFAVASITLINVLLLLLFGPGVYQGKYLVVAIDFVFMILIFHFRDRLNNKIYYFIIVVMWMIMILLHFLHIINIIPSFSIKSWFIVILVMLFRIMAEKYNYQIVSVDELKERMIPAAVTVATFSESRVKDLPTGMTEDLRSRITSENIDAIRRWSRTSKGKPFIMIVRKIPFAIFISAGTIAIILLEGLALCKII